MLQVLDASGDTILLGLRILPLIGCPELLNHPRLRAAGIRAAAGVGGIRGTA